MHVASMSMYTYVLYSQWEHMPYSWRLGDQLMSMWQSGKQGNVLGLAWQASQSYTQHQEDGVTTFRHKTHNVNTQYIASSNTLHQPRSTKQLLLYDPTTSRSTYYCMTLLLVDQPITV